MFVLLCVCGMNWNKYLCVFPAEEELKRLNAELADDDSYCAVSFNYDSSDKTAEVSSTAEASHGEFASLIFFVQFI